VRPDPIFVFRESSRSELKTIASTLLKKREGDIADGRLPALQAEKTTFEDLKRLYLQDYEINRKKSIKRAGQLVAKLTGEFKGHRAIQITTQRVHDYISRRQSEKAANGTINRELTALKRMFKLATQQTPPLVLSIPHIPHLREDNVRRGFFTEEDYKLLRAALPDHLKIPFIIGYWTGMRAGEIVGLRWEQVNLEEGWLRLEPGTTKNGRGRTVPLVQEVREVLQRWREHTLLRYPHCSWICQYRGTQLKRLPKRTWDKICEQVGLKGKLFHDLRRTAVRNMVRVGISERVAMEISGHRTRSVFDRYNIIDEADLVHVRTRLQDWTKNQHQNEVSKT
jgi:integrase